MVLDAGERPATVPWELEATANTKSAREKIAAPCTMPTALR